MSRIGSRAVPSPRMENALAQAASVGLETVRKYGIVVVLLVLGVIATANNSHFLTVTNLFNMGQQWSSVGIMAIAMTFVLISGGFDLSVGGTYAYAATLTAALTQHGRSALFVVAVTLTLGIAIGLVNGLLITKTNINPLVATLGSGQVVTGLALVYSKGGAYNVSGGFFVDVGSGHLGQVPVAVIVTVVLGALAALVLSRSTYGRSLYATGGNPDAAYVSGIPVDGVRILTYVFSGAAAAAAGMVYVGRVSSGQGNVGDGLELTVIAAVLIGGTSIAGGEGSMWRTAAGVALLAVLQNFFDQSSFNSFWQDVVQGVVIIVAVSFESISKRKRSRSLRLLLSFHRRRLRSEHAMLVTSPLSADGARQGAAAHSDPVGERLGTPK